MASMDGGSGRTVEKSRLNFLASFGKGRESWLNRNWRTVVVLLFVVLLAFFIRSYFVWGPSVENGFLVSGGSDSYYHQRVIDHISNTGQHLYIDPLLNYPGGMRNPRPPLFDWSVAVMGMIWSGLTGMAVSDGTGLALITATAVWGALTCIPMYMIGREAFNRKAGLVAAFLFALMPGHIERSVASQADHDAMILFFVVFAFYFLLRSLKTITGDRWVSNWKNYRSVLSGLKSYWKMNQVSLIYAALGGVCVAAVSFIWTGYMYVLIIVLVYFLLQLFINRFRNVDSLGVMMSVGVMLGLTFILAAPLYWTMDYWATWYDVPLLLFLAMIVVGLIFASTRDLPWTLVVPSFLILVTVALAALSFLAPNLFDAIITGQGYLVKSKLYSTISEAQAPSFSTLAMSFGIVTFWLALVGIGYAAIKVRKSLSPHFVFLIVWTGTAVFMAASAGRFLFNAAPAFAIMAGWIVVLIIDAVRFQDYPKGLENPTRPWRSPWPWFKSVFRPKYVMAFFFLFILVLVPNAWAAVDAGIPSEFKKQYDLQIYNAMPSILRPSNYDSVNGSQWYLGAFGFSLPLPSQYWPAAWSWYRYQDSYLPIYDRPAFLSWWDYGFEAIQAGQHPTVADNFQNGYNFAGNYITCTDETQAIAMLVIRCIEYNDLSEGSDVYNALMAHGVDAVKVRDILQNPSKYISVVLGNPETYGRFSSDLSSANAKYIAARVEMAKVGKSELVSLYNKIRAITGNNIGYFAIDSRLFPFTATGYNIFYAPAKLSDHVIDKGSNAPVDFYQIYAVVIQNGQQRTVPLGEITADMTIIDYKIEYTQAFYQTMLYRAFMGYGPYDIGYTQQGIPGISGSLSNLPPMQGWNQSHFRMVYRTAYFNPFPSDQVANHSQAWRAISYDEALILKDKISRGEEIGVVDTSAYSLTQGVVFVQYYDGAIIQGQVRTASGLPYPNVWVTVLDEYGIPHHYVRTDQNGYYSVIAPFGDVDVVFSMGNLDKRLLYASELQRVKYHVTYAQAMRQTDYIIDGDVTITSANLKGKVYWDMDGDGSYDSAQDEIISGARVIATNESLGFRVEAVTTSMGYTINNVPAVSADVYAIVEGHPTTKKPTQILPLADTTVDIGIKPSSIGGTVKYDDGTPAPGFRIVLSDKINGTVSTKSTDDSGAFSFEGLMYGEYEISSGMPGTTFGPLQIKLSEGEKVNKQLIVYPSSILRGQAWLTTGIVASNATILLQNEDLNVVIRADRSGRYSVELPQGTYNLYSTFVSEGRDMAVLKELTLMPGENSFDPLLVPASYLKGKVQGISSLEGLTVLFQSRSSGASLSAKTNETGNFGVILPNDIYFVQMGEEGGAYWNDLTVASSTSLIINLASAAKVNGYVWYDKNGDGARSWDEGLEGVRVEIRDADGRSISKLSGAGGNYEFYLVPGRSFSILVSEEGFASFVKSFEPLTSSSNTDIQLKALNRTVSGTAKISGTGIEGIVIRFESISGDAITKVVQTSTLGTFSVQLHPGSYRIRVDQDTVVGDNSSRYQYEGNLTVEIGKDPSPLTLDLVKRYLVTGTIAPDRGSLATISIYGPDVRSLRAQTSFSIYLQAGEYGFYSLVERLGARYAAIASVTVGPYEINNVNLVTAQAYSIQGSVRFEGKAITGNAPVVISAGSGGSMELKTTLAGTFTTYLPAGEYMASVDFHTTEAIKTRTRYIRYFGDLSFNVAGSKSITINVDKALDNSTLIGSVRVNGEAVAAVLQFIPASSSAIWGNFTVPASSFTVDVAPGEYAIYARELSGPSVFMGKMNVPPRSSSYLNIDLVPGIKFSGTTLLNGRPGNALLEFNSANYAQVKSGQDGSFEIYLPQDDYIVKCTAEGSEKGVAVEYELEFPLKLRNNQISIIDLKKVPKYGVDLSWDAAEKQTIAPGGNVSYNLRIVNTGNVADVFTLSASGFATGWRVSFSQNSVNVDFGPDGAQLVTVTIYTPTNAKVIHPPITIRAQSTKGTASDSVTVDVGIASHHDVWLNYSSASSTSGSEYLYKFTFKNVGNVDDTYNISIPNLSELASWGWKAEIRSGTGPWSSYISSTLAASNQGNLELRLIPLRSNPNARVTIVLTIQSLNSPSTVKVLQFEPSMPNFNIPLGGLTVTGPGVFTEVQQVPTKTVIFIGLLVAVTTILMVFSVQKGVFRRRKR
ncbi:MAG: carboxypeptidase regulatory-like domain-containing protein [Methanomassiliicoccales archaeon]